MFEEPHNNAKLLDNVFLGFKRTVFSDDFIENEVRKTWNQIKYLLNKNLLKETPRKRKSGEIIINKNGVISTQLNFPKAKDYNVFVRGTGQDSSNKTFEINGIKMYRQNIWVKGNVILDLVRDTDFIS